jgi:hypothetical protein
VRLSYLLVENEILQQKEDGWNGPGEYEVLDSCAIPFVGPIHRVLSLCRFRDPAYPKRSSIRLLMSSADVGIGGRITPRWSATWLLHVKNATHVRRIYQEMIASGFHKRPKEWRRVQVEPKGEE